MYYCGMENKVNLFCVCIKLVEIFSFNAHSSGHSILLITTDFCFSAITLKDTCTFYNIIF